ncbi:PAAR domain-containing protein [Vreelandella stevensii]|uniref:PAAR domain-containing protein n=1 Tax=Vreelandella stevensii TaxID=502821 RepID=UPI003749A70B
MSGKPAARITDPTSCSIHGSKPIAEGSPNVIFDNLSAARLGDKSSCGSPITSEVSPTVLINGKPAATEGSVGSHGNPVVSGSATVIIGK